MIDLHKELRKQQRDRRKPAGVDARREHLRTVLTTINDAIAKSPSDELVKARETVAAELKALGSPSGKEKLKEKLAAVEKEMATSHDLSRAQDLIEERAQLLNDIGSFNRG